MNRKATTIWICAAIFCLSLFAALMPVASNNGYLDYGLTAKSIAALVLGWALIISVCAFLAKSKKKRRSY